MLIVYDILNICNILNVYCILNICGIYYSHQLHKALLMKNKPKSILIPMPLYESLQQYANDNHDGNTTAAIMSALNSMLESSGHIKKVAK